MRPMGLNEIPKYHTSEVTLARKNELIDFVKSGAEAAELKRFCKATSSDADGYRNCVRKLNYKSKVIIINRLGRIYAQRLFEEVV